MDLCRFKSLVNTGFETKRWKLYLYWFQKSSYTHADTPYVMNKSGVVDNKQMRPPGIEPGLEAWEATVIPRDHGRLLHKIATPAYSAPLRWAKSMVESIIEEQAPYCHRYVDWVESVPECMYSMRGGIFIWIKNIFGYTTIRSVNMKSHTMDEYKEIGMAFKILNNFMTHLIVKVGKYGKL